MSLTVMIGPLPPPVNGAAQVNAAVQSRLAMYGVERVVDTSVAANDVVPYHLRRLARHARAFTTLIRGSSSSTRRVYVTCPAGLALWYLLPIMVTARALGYYSVVHHHSFDYVRSRSVAMELLVRAVGDSGHNILLCPEMQKRFDDRYRPRRPSVSCSNAAWTSPGPQRINHRASPGPLRIGHMGTLSRAKGLGELSDLLSGLTSEDVESELLLAGQPATPEDKSVLDSLLADQSSHRVRWLGVIAGTQKDQFFRDIDVFVLPSRYRHEAQPLVVFEALSWGVPVISYSIGCIPGQLRGTGMLIPRTAPFVARSVPFLRDLARDCHVLMTARRSARVAFEDAVAEGREDARELLESLT